MKKDGSSPAAAAAAAASSLAIMEKKKKKQQQQQPAAGCIAVFLDLFAKKRKFFPRKLLPPPPPPPVSASAGGVDEKLPVPKMLSDEAGGGGMCAPGVVARLMGLDAVPAPAVSRRNRRIVMLPEKAEPPQELRPRKMQRRGKSLENWSSRSEAAALAVAASSRRRRRSHHTLPSPVNSPRSPISQGRNRARMIGAAVKILEPGLRPRARPPPPSLARLEFSGDGREGSDDADDPLPKNSGPASNNASFGRPIPGAALERRSSSCEGKSQSDCGNFALSDLRNSCSSRDGPADNHKEKTPVIVRGLNRASSSSSPPLPVQCSGNERSSSPISSNRSRTTSPVARASIDVAKGKSNVRINQNRSKNFASNSALKQNNFKHNQLPLASGEVAHRSTVHGRQNNIRDGIALHEAQGFSSARKNPNFSKAPIIKAKGVDRMDAARKERSSNNLRSGNTGVGKPKLGTQRNAEKDLINGKETEQVRTKPVGQNLARSDSWKEAELGNVNVVGSPASCVVSFTFSSPVKHVAGSLNSSDITEKRGEMKESVRIAVSSTELVDSDACCRCSSHEETIFRQEMFCNLVEQETGAVDSLDRGDLEKICDSSVIDQLNPDQKNASDWRESLMMTIKKKIQDAAKESTSTALPARDIDHLIGASLTGDDDNGFSGRSNATTTVLESNFSQNESKQESDFKEASWSRNEQKNSPSSADSMTRSRDVLRYEVAIQERKVRFPAEALSTAELLLENIYSFGSDRPKDSFVELFFREKMGSILGALYMSSRSGFNFTEEPKTGNQLRNLVHECVIEFLASMHDCFYNSGYKSWLKLIGFFTKDGLLSDIKKEIRGWNNAAGKALDHLLDKDLDHSNDIWIDFSIESFQIGTRVGDDILQLLIDEIAMGVH